MDWNALEKECKNCNKCALADSRTQVVFGTGNPRAKVLFVGEAPGEKEDLSGQPFVGRSGKLLDEILAVIDLDRNKNIYIANMVKCRPPKNRNPLKTEQRACLDYLRGQVGFMKPKIIVCLGLVAAQSLIAPEFKTKDDHGVFFQKNGVEMMGLYHPAALLRNPHHKPVTFQDLKILQKKIIEIAPETYEMES
ncbi:MAG: uracil-DNA glycosylase [Eubacteriales bacterium]